MKIPSSDTGLVINLFPLAVWMFSSIFQMGNVSKTFVASLPWWVWKDVVQMCCAFLTVLLVHLDPPVQSCCAQYGGTGVWSVHTLYSFVLQEFNSVCCLWSDPHCGHWVAKREMSCKRAWKQGPQTLNSLPSVSTSSNPYLETERDDWAFKPPFLWNSVGHSCVPLVCSAWGPKGVGRLWFGGHIRHYCRFWA